MKEFHFLGASKSSVAIIFDIITEIHGPSIFKFYPNLDKEILPALPIKNFKYKIENLGTTPDDSEQVFLATPGPFNKASVFHYFKDFHGILEHRYFNIIHPSAYVADSSALNNGVLIEPHVIISSQVRIGFGVLVKRGSSVGHHSTIGLFTDINPGVVISGNVRIGVGCEIGTGAMIRDSVTIGDNVVIGMGSVVTKDIPSNCIAYGNPCKVVKELPELKIYSGIR
ncbi:hypothetical protein ACXGQW_06870 [Wenyingzhuangia sp. IMCC45533]